jgi:hypothetical protein
MNTTRIRASVAAAAIAATFFTPTVAEAGELDALRQGACSGAADWKLRVSPQDRRLEVEFEVDANRRGQQWRVVMFHGQRRIARDTFRTRVPSGSFTVRRVTADRSGGDRFRARAVRVGDGQRCVGRVRF